MKFLGSSKISGKNLITIPQEAVKVLAVKQGDFLLFLQDDEGNVYVAKEVTLLTKQK